MRIDNQPASSGRSKPGQLASRNHPLLWVLLLLVISLSALFWKSFNPTYVHFSNDGPLGAMVAQQNRMPHTLTGLWQDLTWLGSEGLSSSPSVSTFLLGALGPFLYGSFLPPLSLFIVGICAYFCFRKLKLSPLACVLGGTAAALNSDFLSTACWGVAAQIIGFGAMYVALGLLNDLHGRRRIVKVILAGMAVGVGIMEAYDIGALFSLVIALFVLYQTLFLIDEAKISAKKIGGGILRIALVACFAAYLATHTLSLLIGTQIQGVVGTAQDREVKQKQWSFVTQWSLPKAEALQVFIPGIFGYRMDAPNGANYWGTIGITPQLQQAAQILSDPNSTDNMRAQAKAVEGISGAYWRFSGTGYYAGIPVLLLALWAACQSFRRENSVFSLLQRRAIWLWSGLAVVCFVLAFGKYAPFFQIWYALPYASVVRNPAKFMHIFHWVMLILFAYGIHGFSLLYLKNLPARAVSQSQNFLQRAGSFERKWLIGCVIALGLGLVGWMVYDSHYSQLEAYIASMGIDPTLAPPIAKFSVHSVGWFILFLGLSTILFALIFRGNFTGKNVLTGGMLLGALVVLDLAISDSHWVLYWNAGYKYASNPIVDLLRDKPYEHRVDFLPYGSGSQQMTYFRQLYDIEWHQQLFPYYNIQAYKVVMEPRVSEDKDRFLAALPLTNSFNQLRLWELTNVRYLLGNGGESFVAALNAQFDPVQKRFRLLNLPNGDPANFNIVTKPNPGNPLNLVDLTVAPNPKGELGLIEFTGALPRAQLFSNWQVDTNDDHTLHLLGDPAFDPHQIVLVDSTNLPVPAPANLNQPAGTVTINPNYRPKRIELDADVKMPSVLLMTDRYNSKWHVTVDGQPAQLLRCDYILRGVYLQPGHHKIVLHFTTPLTTLYVSLSAIALGLVLCGWLVFARDDEQTIASPRTEPSKPKKS